MMGLSIFLRETSDSVEGVSSARKYSGTIFEVDCSYRSTYNRSHIDFTLDDGTVLFFRVVGISCDQLYAANLIGSSVVAYYSRGFAWQVDVNNQTLLPFSTTRFSYNFMILAVVNIPLLGALASSLGRIYRSKKKSKAAKVEFPTVK